MIGGMIAATVALSMFNLQEDPALGTLVPAILVALLFAMAGCALLNATIERVAYRPLRRAPRLVPLITAIGVSFILQNVALIWKGSAAGRDAEVAAGRRDLHRRHLPELRRLYAGIASFRS